MMATTVNPIMRLISGSCKDAMMTLFILISALCCCDGGGGFRRRVCIVDAVQM